MDVSPSYSEGSSLGVCLGVAAGRLAAVSELPHSLQNLAVGEFAKPHEGQVPGARSGVAHWLQNFAPAGFS
jgi:hypothetical protein